MRRSLPLSFFQFTFLIVFLLISFIGNAQIVKVEIQGGANVMVGSTVTINAGNSLTFRVSNSETSNCKSLKVNNVVLSGASGGTFVINPFSPNDNIKPANCNGDHDLLYTVARTDAICSTATVTVTVVTNQGNFVYTFRVIRSPKINVSGGTPLADISHGSTLTKSTNGTFFGVVTGGNTVTRRYIISNTGSCNLNVSSLSSSNPEFTISVPFPFSVPSDIVVFGLIVIDVSFNAPLGGIGTKASIISINNNDNTTFTFRVSGEMFNYSIPGPGGITADFRLWLKGTRGVNTTGTSVDTWRDLGTNGKDATSIAGKKPTYLDDVASNINFHPVIKFENNGGGLDQYLLNDTSGFFSQDIFIVAIPDTPMTNVSSKNTLFAGTISGVAGDVTGVGFGDYSTRQTNEALSYNQGVTSPIGSYNGEGINATYSKPGIINVRNNVAGTRQQILYNSNPLTTTQVTDVAFANVNGATGSKYWIGKNLDGQGSLNGRVAEIFTFASRVSDAGRQKIETYLAIKYGITLGDSNQANKNYINSFDTTVWNVTTNAGYNYDVAGIGKDSISDLFQRQSKTINISNDVTIGLGALSTKNSLNTNTFTKDGDFLVWGNNNGPYTGASTNLVTIATGITTSLTRIDRKWKIVETKQIVTSDVGNVYIGIPANAFSGFTKAANEEYVLIVADNPNFANSDIIDVIPLKINKDAYGNPILDKDLSQVYTTWYNFDDTKYFTFGKAPKLLQNRAISIETGDYLVGESNLNLSVDNFSIAAWIKCAPTAAIRTIMAKGEKLQMRLNTANKIEILIDDKVTPKFISNISISDNKWHHIAFVYESGTILLYIDGILDQSIQDVVHPSPNFNHFCIGGVYLNSNSILNPLLGDVDEVSVWDLALSIDQVRYIMNQEIKPSGGMISGKELPFAASSNEVNTSLWSGLRVYYDFNSFYGSTVEGLTNDRYFLRLRYLNKNKTVVRTQTIPVPYVTAANGDWDNTTTWANSSDNMLPNSIGLDGTTKINWNIVQIDHEILSGDRNISLSGLIMQSAGILTMADPIDPQNETNSGQSLTISHYLELDGKIDLIGESQLIQTDGSIIDADSGGFIERDQQGTANGFNYNYWSSSVGPIGGNTGTRGNGVSSTNGNVSMSEFLFNGSDSSSYSNMQYDSTLYNYTPAGPPGLIRTIYTYWLYKFYGPADDYNAWGKIDQNSLLLAGEGFTMKGPLGSAPISTQQNYVFKGLPNNGDITLALDKTSGEVERLIGNPYPSALDANEFIRDNLSDAEGGNNTNTIINGALYFWDHFGQEDSHYLKAYVGGYATYNLIGGAPAISNDARINNTSNAGSAAIGTKIPGQYIPVNQAFFVSTKWESNPNDDSGIISSVDGGNIIFKNSQRVFATENGVSSIFMKSSKDKSSSKTVANSPKSSTPTIRLEYVSPLGYHRQLVIGANKNASKGYDLGYDAFMVDVNEEDMYWNMNTNKLVIQGVQEFIKSEEFSLGLIVKTSGIAKIKLDGLENIDASLMVSIKDELTGETKNIKTDSFEVNLEPGVYNDRFKLVFNKLEENIPVIENIVDKSTASSISINYEIKSKKLNLINKDKINIKDFALYDMLGNKIKASKLNTKSDASLRVSATTGLYIVKLNTENGVVTKKIIIE